MRKTKTTTNNNKKTACVKSKLAYTVFFCLNSGKTKKDMIKECDFADLIEKDGKFLCKFKSEAYCINDDVKYQIQNRLK